MRLNKCLASIFAAPVVLCTVVLCTVAVQAAPIPWTTPSGNTNDFTFNNGNTDNQLFVPAGGDPVVTATGLLFFPSGFAAQSANGIAQITRDTLRFDIHVKPNKQLAAFSINEFGDYSILGTGVQTAVKAFGAVFLTNLDTGDVRSDSLITVPAALSGATGVTSGQGQWTGSELIANIPAGWKNIRVVLNNELHAGSDQGTSSFIEKKVVTPGIEINIILPEPASLSMLALGGLLISRRRRVA